MNTKTDYVLAPAAPHAPKPPVDEDKVACEKALMNCDTAKPIECFQQGWQAGRDYEASKRERGER